MTRVLVVDDKEDNLYYLQALLRGHGFDVDVARHGAEALVLARQQAPDMVVSDLLMPVMDGYTLLRHWKADERLKHVPFVVYTATYTEADDERLALDLGADAFILKPAEPEDFLSQIREVEARPETAAPNTPNVQAGEEVLLKTYSESLIRKLEEKTLQLEETNHALEADITERKRVEVALRASIDELKHAQTRISEQARLLDLTQDAIVVYDLEHRVRYWNQGAARLFGWSAQEATGGRIDELHVPDLAQHRSAVDPVLTQGEWSGELRFTNRHGDEVVTDSRLTLLPNTDDGSILVVSTDVTERKQIESQFLRAQRLESIGTLAGGIAHDLNNLLAPILIGAELLRLQDLNDEGREVVDTIEVSAQRGADLIRQVLSFARGIDGARMAVNVDEVVREVVSIARTTFPKEVEVEVHVADDLWPVVGDPTQLNQVLLNLCVNARDAMGEGGTLTLSAHNSEIATSDVSGPSTARFVIIEVRDTGCGIPRELLERIFEPFMTTKAMGNGTGLGLSTVTGIVNGHGGSTEVESRVGVGSTFTVRLPADTATATAQPPPVQQHGHDAVVLVVDDEAAILTMTKHTLDSIGYRVLTARDGADAMSQYAAADGSVAVVLTDMTMPVMDGASLIAALHAIDPDLPIIATSGVTSLPTPSPGESRRSTYFLPKPYPATDLLTLLRSVLDRPPR